eukprot:gene27197-33479_t
MAAPGSLIRAEQVMAAEYASVKVLVVSHGEEMLDEAFLAGLTATLDALKGTENNHKAFSVSVEELPPATIQVDALPAAFSAYRILQWLQSQQPPLDVVHLTAPALGHYSVLARRQHLALENTAFVAHCRQGCLRSHAHPKPPVQSPLPAYLPLLACGMRWAPPRDRVPPSAGKMSYSDVDELEYEFMETSVIEGADAVVFEGGSAAAEMAQAQREVLAPGPSFKGAPPALHVLPLPTSPEALAFSNPKPSTFVRMLRSVASVVF